VTRKRPGTAAADAYTPNEILVQRYASSYSWDKEKLTAALSKFGPLSHAGQEQLIKNLVEAFAGFITERVTAGERHKQLEEIEKTAQKLLCLLNIDLISGLRKDRLPTVWLEQVGIDYRGRDANTVYAEFAEAQGEVANSIIALRKIHQRAKVAAKEGGTQVDRRRGGAHHHPGQRGQLIRDAKVIYQYMKGQHPESGNKPGMRKFVRAVGELFGVAVSSPKCNSAA
jgi:hypothetical protein